MTNFFGYFKKYWVGLVLMIILAGAFWVRFYHFDEWLYFKMDQSRDALLLSDALRYGPADLPLLGARVGAVTLKHGFLRLGPIYYYFQYIAASLFPNQVPAAFAYPDFFFSLLAIVLLYFFARLYFSRMTSLLVTLMYAFSFLIIQYSRFAWNPNSLQFFILLSFYGLIRFLNEERAGWKKIWLIFWITGVTIGSQLHFFGFFSLLGISGLLILMHLRVWQRESFLALFRREAMKEFAKFFGIGLFIFSLFYSPVIISDIYKHGQNTHNFFEALGTKAAKKPLVEKLQKDLTENLGYYCLLTTSECYTGDWKKNMLPTAGSAAVLILGIVLAFWGWRRAATQQGKDFLALLVIWFGVFTVLTIPVAFQLRPRFYIVVFALPFLFLGLLYSFLEEHYGWKALVASFFITAGVLALNIRGTTLWFQEQAKAQVQPIQPKRTLILKAKDGVTLGQLQKVADWMYARHTKGSTLYYYVKPEHVRPIEYLLFAKNEPGFIFRTFKITGEPNTQYFAVTPADKEMGPFTKKFGSDYVIVDQARFGQLLVSEVNFPHREVFPDYRFSRKGGSTDRIFWGDVFGVKAQKDSIKLDAGE